VDSACRELRNVGIRYGTSIRRHTQLIASFHWSKPRLGPAAAKNLADLFEGEPYETVCQTQAELVFQLYLLDGALRESRWDLANAKMYVRNLKRKEYFALFSLAVRALTEVGAKWNDPDLTAQLQGQRKEYYPTHNNLWRKLTKACIDHIRAAFNKESRAYSRREGEELTDTNYFKAQGYMARMLKSGLPGEIKRCARAALKP
jgi:hypothetical protein